jgi:hypothetical protein
MYPCLLLMHTHVRSSTEHYIDQYPSWQPGAAAPNKPCLSLVAPCRWQPGRHAASCPTQSYGSCCQRAPRLKQRPMRTSLSRRQQCQAMQQVVRQDPAAAGAAPPAAGLCGSKAAAPPAAACQRVWQSHLLLWMSTTAAVAVHSRVSRLPQWPPITLRSCMATGTAWWEQTSGSWGSCRRRLGGLAGTPGGHTAAVAMLYSSGALQNVCRPVHGDMHS